MEKRKLGRTGQMSSIITFGSYALFKVSQKEADAAIETALKAGINQVDVSPGYGQAEVRLGSFFKRHGNSFFLGCKTTERTKKGAWESLKRSLETLHVDHFDLFQFHGVKNNTELDTLLGPGGALEAVLEAKKQGLVRFIGITGHHPLLFNEALGLFDFDTVMFPLNRVHAAHFNDWNDWRPLLKTARQKDVGVFAIKSVAKRVWEDEDREKHKYNTWYEPFDEAGDIEKSLRYTLSQDITSAVLPGELKLWPMIFDAAERFRPMTPKEQRQVITEVSQYPPLHAPFFEQSNW
jgi:aryl-alcohol dehydrogenase-like predicted oxidoreductase